MRLTTALMIALLAGCATTGIERDGVIPIERESITYATSPCFGTCPVYSVTIQPDGQGVFEGKRFTAVTGARQFSVDPAAYRRFADALAPYRPQGERVIEPGSPECGPAPTDMPSVDIRWSSLSGASDHLAFYYGCRRDDRAMADTLRGAPNMLPIAELIGKR